LIFVDAGAWIALLKRNDNFHERAKNYYAARVSDGSNFLTTNYVIDETATRLRYSAGLDAALSFHSALQEAVAGKRLRMTWVDSRLEAQGWEVLASNPEVELSLTDAISISVIHRARIKTVFGFDTDFVSMGLDLQPGQ